jgi:ribosome biogenesis GTPase
MPEGELGRVIEVSTGLCRVVVDGEIWLCYLRGGLSAQETGFTNVVAVGDQVHVLSDGQAGGVVIGVLPRRNHLARPDPFYRHLHQVIAANLDQLLIVAAWRDPVIWAELIDRYLITAQRHNIQPLICINKVDLADNLSDVDEYTLPYRNLGHPVLPTSVVGGTGLAELREYLSGKVTVLAGVSGVGKSSLLSAVEPGFQLKTSEVSQVSGEGRHTTTQVVMLPFGADGYVIDTPGIREFGLRGLTVAELLGYYPDFALYPCRFRACTHTHEPDCAVIKAVEAGAIPAWRYHSYQKIFESLDG